MVRHVQGGAGCNIVYVLVFLHVCVIGWRAQGGVCGRWCQAGGGWACRLASRRSTRPHCACSSRWRSSSRRVAPVGRRFVYFQLYFLKDLAAAGTP